MLRFLALRVYVRDFAKILTRPQKRKIMIEYSKINEIPQEIRDLIKSEVLFDQSPVKQLYIKCGITDYCDMIDNFLHILYIYVNYEPEEEENTGMFII